jgi:hypothetical protein
VPDQSNVTTDGRTGGGLKPNCAQTSLSQCHFFHDKSQMNWPGSEAGSGGERLKQGGARMAGVGVWT